VSLPAVSLCLVSTPLSLFVIQQERGHGTICILLSTDSVTFLACVLVIDWSGFPHERHKTAYLLTYSLSLAQIYVCLLVVNIFYPCNTE